MIDLPAPKRGAAFDGLDLPAPKGGFTDLPAPKASGVLDELDLPAPKFGGLDLPAPKAGGIDLPAPKFGGVDLPAPKLDTLDLPTAKGGIDLPAPRGAAGPKAPPQPPRPPTPGGRVPPPAPKATGASFGELDLDAPPRSSGAALGDLDLGAPPVGGGLDLGLDLDLPSARPRGDAPAKRTGGALFASDPPPSMDDDVGLDDLALPAARARPVPNVTPDGRKGAGGAAFGELDLGGGDDFGDGEDLEFGGIPQSSGPASLPGLDDAPALVQTSEKSQATRREESKAQAVVARKKRFSRSLAAIFVVAALLGGVGFALRFTKHGNFGIYFFERFLPAAKGGETVRDAITRADTMAADDTYTSARAAIALLGDQRRTFGLDRTLLVRSVVHEALYIARFGEDANASSRINRITTRLDERANDAPGIELALAANDLRLGHLASAGTHLSRARATSNTDPLYDIVEGELALASGRTEAAAAAFRRAQTHGARARGAWGLARAELALKAAGAPAAIDATLTASPLHVEARIAKARLALAAGDLDEALTVGRVAAGLDPHEGRLLRGGPTARADAFVVVGTVEERRGHREAARAAYEAAVRIDGYDLEALVGSGRVLLLESKPREALVRLESAVQVAEAARPSSPSERTRVAAMLREARLAAVRALLLLERAQDALPIVNTLLGLAPDDPIVLLAQGHIAEALEQTEQAEASYRKAIEKAPTSFDGYLALSLLYFTLERSDDAARVLTEAEAHVAITADVRRAKGEAELRRDDLEAAIREFRGAIELDPNDRASIFGLGVAQRRSRDLAAAQATFDKLASMDATYPGLALERGLVFEARGDAPEAVLAYTRALESRPNDYELMTRLGGAQVSAEQLDPAERTLRTVLEHEPGNALALHYMGRLEFARGRIREAVTFLSRAVSLDAQRAEFRVHLAWAHLEDNDLGAAQSQINAALERDPSLGDAYWLRARLYARTGRAQEGLADAAQALERNPSRVEAWAVIGDCQEQLGRPADAIAAYQRATTAKPRMAEWWYRLGRLAFDAGRGTDAATALAKAAELADAERPAPGWLADAHRVLGDALYARGDRSGAATHYRRYLEIAPASAIDRREVQERLTSLGG